MGSALSLFLRRFFQRQEVRVLVVGLDQAGKTSFLNKLQYGAISTTIPTVGFNIEVIKHKNITFTMWDVGGQEKIRSLWKHYYAGTQAIIFMVDSSDTERMNDEKKISTTSTAHSELHNLLKEKQLKNTALLVMANKQDLASRALTVSEIQDRLELRKIIHHPWYIQGCSILTGAGLKEGLNWLCQVLKEMKQEEKKIIR